MNALNGLRNAALILTIAAGTSLTGCSEGSVGGRAVVDIGIGRFEIEFKGRTTATPPGPLTPLGKGEFRGREYDLFVGADGKVYAYVPGIGYIEFGLLNDLLPKPLGDGGSTDSDYARQVAQAPGFTQSRRGTTGPTLEGVTFSFDRNARTAALDFPSFAGLKLPGNHAELRVQVMVYTAGAEERVRVTGFDHGVLIYAANCGLTNLSVPASALHGPLSIKTERAALAVRDGRLTLAAVEIATTSIDDLNTPGVDEIVFLTEN